MAYVTAGEIIADVARERGLGVVSDPYGSQNAQIQQLCGLLKSGGRKLVFERDWTYLIAEYVFVTLPNWQAGTLYEDANSVDGWTTNFGLDAGDLVLNFGNLYRTTTPGTTSLTGLGPNTQTQGIVDGGCTWNFQSASTGSVVVKGLYQYTCVGRGISGTTGPTGTVLNG